MCVSVACTKSSGIVQPVPSSTYHTVGLAVASCPPSAESCMTVLHRVPAVSHVQTSWPPPRWPSGKASASRAEDPGFESRLRRDFFGVESYQ